jgi:hypothetical protein
MASTASPDLDMSIAAIIARSQRNGTAKRIAATQRADDRYAAEVETIKASRPLGTDAYRPEPKSIHDSVPRARIGYEPPKARSKPVRRGLGGIENGLPTGRGAQSYHRPVRSVRWPGDEGY